MSDYAYIADRAKRAHASIAKLEIELMRDPENAALQINLASMRKYAERTRLEMEALAKANHIEICEYKVVPQFEDKYGLEFVSKSLLSYQYMFSQIYDSFANGLKVKAHIGKEAAAESALDFAFSFSGSLGVVLLAQSERTFFDGKLDKPIDALYQVLEIENADDVREIGHVRGRAVVKRIHDWSKANVDGGFSADVRWKRSDGRLKGQMIDHGRMLKIVEFIDSAADQNVNMHIVRGMLVGGDVVSRTFHLTVPQGESYNGHIADDAELTEMTLGKMYEAVIAVTETLYYAQDRTQTTSSLKKLSGPIETAS